MAVPKKKHPRSRTGRRKNTHKHKKISSMLQHARTQLGRSKSK